VSWRVNAERLVLFGWTRAILLQFAHPLVAAGVHEHSGFRASPLAAVKRLRHTVQAMLAIAFGTDVDRERAIDAIRQIHRRVNGVLAAPVGPFAAGTRYSAEDPALVLWVHLTLIESIIFSYELLVGPLSESERDAYCAESAAPALALGAVDRDVPRTWQGVREAVARTYASGQIAIGPDARALAIAVVRPRGARLAGPLAWINEVMAIGLLPSHIRDEYGFAWTSTRQRAFTVTVRAIRLLRRALPEVLMLWRAARTTR
jgi:uncharacterized protein (DUF2236 family)